MFSDDSIKTFWIALVAILIFVFLMLTHPDAKADPFVKRTESTLFISWNPALWCEDTYPDCVYSTWVGKFSDNLVEYKAGEFKLSDPKFRGLTLTATELSALGFLPGDTFYFDVSAATTSEGYWKSSGPVSQSLDISFFGEEVKNLTVIRK